MSETGDQAPAKPARRKPRKKAQMPARAYGRSLSDFELLGAERLLLEKTILGEVAEIESHRPEAADNQNTVRAEFLRFLLLGGDTNIHIHEHGIRLRGAHIDGPLDLENATTVCPLSCAFSTFNAPLILRRSTLSGGLFLTGCTIPGIQGDSMVVRGDVFLRQGFRSMGTIKLPGAHISGDLVLDGAELNGNGGNSLSADRARIEGNVFLRNGFKAIGTVRLIGARIGSDLSCTNGQFHGTQGNAITIEGASIRGNVFLRDEFTATGSVRLIGTRIEGDLSCAKGIFNGDKARSIIANRMQVNGGFFFRNLKEKPKKVSLTHASVGVLVDDPDAWGEELVLDGFTYSLGGNAPTSAMERLTWLDKQTSDMSGLSGPGTDFRPQPWKQLQKVLREMGHNEDARQVAIAFEHRLRKADLIGVAPPQWGWLRRKLYRHLSRFFHWCFWILTGYGYRPMRLMAWMLAVWLCSAAFYWFTALPQRDVFAPSNPLVFQHPHYQICAPETPESKAELAKPPEQQSVVGAGNWYLCEKLRGEYTGFSPLAYSLDVLLPLVDLQQQKDWGPIIPTPKSSWWQELFAPSWGHAARLVIWFQTLFGWVASLLLVAIVSGLTKRRED